MKLLKISVIFIFMMAFLISTASAAKLDLSRLLVLYLCDENGGNVLNDSSGNGWDADVPKAEWEKGVFNNAVRLRGTNSTVEGDIISSVGKTGEISIMCWLNMAKHTNYNGIISIEADDAGCCEFRLMVNPAKNPFWDAGRHADKSLVNFTFDLNQWYHYAMVADGKVTKIYIDGKFIGEQAENFPLPEFRNVKLYVGTGEAPGTWLIEDSAIDEVMIWDKALEEDEMKIVMEGFKVFAPVGAEGKLAGTWGGLKAE